MPIKESLQQLMKQEGWTAEQVTNAIKKLQSCNSVYACLPIMWQKLLVYMIDYNVVERASCRQGDLRWILVHEFSAEYPAISYRISPDFVIPDLEETKPRYESGTWRVDPNDGEAVVVVDREEWYKAHERTSAPHEAKPDWWAVKTAHGIMWEDEEGCLPLPPRHDLAEGWEYTGKAACIDGKQKLGEDEAWVNTLGGVVTNESEPSVEATLGGWRHIARKKKEEPKPVEYVDWPIVPDAHNCILLVDDGDQETVNHCFDTFVGSPRFIAYIYADGTTSTSPRLPNEDCGPALIPTHVRMAKEAE